MPSSWNVTFKEPCEEFQSRDLEKCLPKDERSGFIAEVTPENGNIVQKGRLLKGRVTIHSTHGSTTMSEISVGIWTAYREHWAQAQAVAGGDSGFYKSHKRCGYALSNQPLNAESSMYAHIFDDKFERTYSYPPVTLASVDADNSTLTPARPYFDFQFEVPRDTVVDFPSYYSNSENQLLFNFDVLYASEVADCMGLSPPRPPRTAADEAAAQEELLWEPYARLGHPANFTTPKTQIKNRRCLMQLVAMVPITVVGSAAQTSRPVAHYLTPDLPVPVLRAGVQVEMPKFLSQTQWLAPSRLLTRLRGCCSHTHKAAGTRMHSTSTFQIPPKNIVEVIMRVCFGRRRS
ncbi:hypothetical protein B0H13DRAFT_1857748 [Mycena leptocephala]|nr:hypothetical protein B0H13DRAFT_1857748 [Mycena leptocephala]